MDGATRRLDALTGMRFAAALLVAANHLPFVSDHPDFPAAWRPYLHGAGLAAIPFFFILSGFVMAYVYAGRFPDLRGSRVRQFYAARAVRVAPVHLLTFALVALFPYTAISVPTDPPWRNGWRVAAHLLLIQTWVPDYRGLPLFNPVSWTLAAEVFFYLCLPGLLWAAGRRRLGRAALPAVALVCAAQAVTVLVVGRKETAFTVWFCALSPYVHMPEFLAGMLLGLRVAERPPAATGPRWLGTLAELAAVGALVGMIAVQGVAPRLLWYTGYFTPAAALVVGVFARQAGYLSLLLSWRPAVFLGEVSYPFYLLHCLIFFHANRLVGDTAGVGAAAAGVGMLLAVAVVASAVYRWYETPVRRALGKLIRPRRPAVTAPAAAERPLSRAA